MSVEILVPALDAEMTEAKIVRWLKSEGDPVEKGESVVEVETDKAVVEVEAEGSGRLGKCQAEEGEVVPVNTAIGVILATDEEGEGKDTPKNKEKNGIGVSTPEFHESSGQKTKPGLGEAGIVSPKRIFVSPLARRLARLHGLDLSQLAGSGPNNRIVKIDIERALARRRSSQKTETVSSSERLDSELASLPESTAIEHTAMRSTIAKSLIRSSRDVPHYFLTVDCIVDKLLSLRQEINDAAVFPAKVSLNDFFIKAASFALLQVPAANVAWTDSAILKFHQADIAIAVSVEDGLITPVIRKVEQKSLVEVARESEDLIKRARNGKLHPEDYRGGTFTISNLGMYGIKSFTSIINPPQSAIFSLGAAEPRPVVQEDQIDVATVMTVTLALDHRCIDGVVGAKLLSAFKDFVEAPIAILLRDGLLPKSV